MLNKRSAVARPSITSTRLASTLYRYGKKAISQVQSKLANPTHDFLYGEPIFFTCPVHFSTQSQAIRSGRLIQALLNGETRYNQQQLPTARLTPQFQIGLNEANQLVIRLSILIRSTEQNLLNSSPEFMATLASFQQQCKQTLINEIWPRLYNRINKESSQKMKKPT